MKKKALTIDDYSRLCSQAKVSSSLLNMLASCIDWHSKRKIALASISLKPALYERFVQTMWKINGAPMEEGTPFEICKVEIKKGSIFQVREMLPEQWKDFQHNIGEKMPNVVHP